MKITLDSNVLIAGFIARGTCEVIIKKWFSRQFEVTLSEYILEEVTKSLQKKIKVPVEKTNEIERLLRQEARLVRPDAVDESRLRDQKDLPILGTAIAGNVKILVTGDQDLLVLKKFKKIKILTPREFLTVYLKI